MLPSWFLSDSLRDIHRAWADLTFLSEKGYSIRGGLSRGSACETSWDNLSTYRLSEKWEVLEGAHNSYGAPIPWCYEVKKMVERSIGPVPPSAFGISPRGGDSPMGQTMACKTHRDNGQMGRRPLPFRGRWLDGPITSIQDPLLMMIKCWNHLHKKIRDDKRNISADKINIKNHLKSRKHSCSIKTTVKKNLKPWTFIE